MKNKISYYSIRDIEALIDENKLILQPDFQRKYIWDSEKKINLIDSILREWVLPPILCVENETSNKFEVIDGQQRLTSIYNFIKNKFPYKNNLLFKELNKDDRLIIMNYKIVFFVIEDIDTKTIGEYFYRLNDQVALTLTEKRNAYSGDFKDIVKTLVNEFIEKGFNEENLKISNHRFEYEDILSRLFVYVDQGNLSLDIDLCLNDYYKGISKLKTDTIENTRYAMDNFCKILAKLNSNKDFSMWHESNIITTLYALAIYPNKYKINQSDFNNFLIDFERKRCEVKLDIQSIYSNKLIKEKYNELFITFNTFLTLEARSTRSTEIRELILRLLFFSNFEYIFYNNQAISIKEEILYDSLISDDELYSVYDIESLLNDYLDRNESH